MYPQQLDEPGHRPAKGLTALTWPQIERIDALVSRLCELTAGGASATLTLHVRRGKLRLVERPVLVEELEPGRGDTP
jgi:hypothetical protein